MLNRRQTIAGCFSANVFHFFCSPHGLKGDWSILLGLQTETGMLPTAKSCGTPSDYAFGLDICLERITQQRIRQQIIKKTVLLLQISYLRTAPQWLMQAEEYIPSWS